jgi:hypothetical protein
MCDREHRLSGHQRVLSGQLVESAFLDPERVHDRLRRRARPGGTTCRPLRASAFLLLGVLIFLAASAACGVAASVGVRSSARRYYD